MTFVITFEHEHYLLIKKPAGFFVHRPEDRRIKVSADRIILANLRDQIGCRVYPIHRLDAATEGLLLFAKSPDSASLLTQAYLSTAQKKYKAVCRGWVHSQTIQIPLKSDSSDLLLESETEITSLQQISLPFPVGNRYTEARYSLIQAFPKTGRFHQIRRHMNQISHPLIGDAYHGDTRHNRFFRELTQIQGLLLWHERVEFICPYQQKIVEFQDSPSEKWQNIHSFFNDPHKYCASLSHPLT